MQSAVSKITLSDDLDHKSSLDEILFWTVKYEFPEKITTWLLGLLPDDDFKVTLISYVLLLVSYVFLFDITLYVLTGSVYLCIC